MLYKILDFFRNETTSYYFKYDNLLISKLLLFNAFVFSVVIYLVHNGFLYYVHSVDDTHITLTILALTLITCGISIHKAAIINNELKRLKTENKRKLLNEIIHMTNISLQNDRNRKAVEVALMSRISLIKYISRMLVILGLIGTVVGFIMVFFTTDITLGNMESLKQILPALLKGMGVALFTTLFGSVGNVILDINHRMLYRATTELYVRFLLKDENGDS